MEFCYLVLFEVTKGTSDLPVSLCPLPNLWDLKQSIALEVEVGTVCCFVLCFFFKSPEGCKLISKTRKIDIIRDS